MVRLVRKSRPDDSRRVKETREQEIVSCFFLKIVYFKTPPTLHPRRPSVAFTNLHFSSPQETHLSKELKRNTHGAPPTTTTSGPRRTGFRNTRRTTFVVSKEMYPFQVVPLVVPVREPFPALARARGRGGGDDDSKTETTRGQRQKRC